MTAAVISLVSCQTKEIVSESRTMTIIASSDLTKTANSGMSTVWADGDQLHVFYLDPAVATHASYVKAGVFTISDGVGTKSGAFTGEAASVPSAATKWFAIYTGSSSANPTTPAGRQSADGYVFVSRSNGISQPSYDDMSAVSGSHCPMYGIAENVATSKSPSFTMKQIASVIEFNVVNNTGGTLVVNSLQLEELTDVAGQYYLDITGSEPALVAVADKTVTNPVVNITKPAELAAGASAKVYMPVKPFKHAPVAGMTVTVSGSVDGKSGSKSIGLNPLSDAQCTFVAGKIKTVTVTVSDFEYLSAGTVKQALEGTVGEEHLVSEAIVTWANNNSVLVTDDTGTILVYKSGHGLALGDAVKVAGKTKAYNNLVEFDTPTIEKVTKTLNIKLAPKSWTIDQILAAYQNAQIVYISAEVPFTTASNGKLGDSDIVLYVSKATGVTISKNKTYKITGFIYGWMDFGSPVTKEVCMYVDSATEVQTAEANLALEPSSLTFEQTGGSENVTVTSDDNNWTVDTSTVPDWLTVTKASSFAGLIVTAAANNDTKRTANITVKHSNGTLTKTLKVTQNGAIEEDTLSLGAASISFGSKNNDPIEVTVTSNNANWTVDATTVPSWLTVTADKESSPMKLVVSAADNTGEARNAEITVQHANGTLTRTLKVGQNAASSGGSKTYVKVTSGTISSGEYIFVYSADGASGFAMNGGLSTLDASSNGVAVTISGGKITYSGDDVYFTYDSSEGSFKGAGGAYIAHSAKSNNIANVTTYAEGTCKMVVSFDADGNVVVTAPTTYVLKYNSNSGQNRFRFYTSTSSQKSIMLFKKQ